MTSLNIYAQEPEGADLPTELCGLPSAETALVQILGSTTSVRSFG
jgi:hypothetical protein